MPKVSWEEINDIIHKCKDTLVLAHHIEDFNKKSTRLSIKMRKRLESELKKIEDIILEQTKRDE